MADGTHWCGMATHLTWPLSLEDLDKRPLAAQYVLHTLYGGDLCSACSSVSLVMPDPLTRDEVMLLHSLLLSQLFPSLPTHLPE